MQALVPQHQCYTVVVLSTQVLEAPAQSATVPSAPLHFMPSGLSFTSKRCILKDPTFPPIFPHFFLLLFMFDWQFVQVSLMFSDKYDVCRHCLLTQGRFGVFTNKKLTHSFFGKMNHWWNKFYTWSHLKIFIFASVQQKHIVYQFTFAQNRPKSDISGALINTH